MIALYLVLLPVVAAALVYAAGNRSAWVRGGFIAASLLHFAGVLLFCLYPDQFATEGGVWLAGDEIGCWILSMVSFLFVCSSFYAWRWLPAAHRFEEANGNVPMRKNLFCAVCLLLLTTMTLVTLAQNFGLLWVAVEASTLASAPLICFHRTARSLEAMWKYLLICSVGIGLALFGTMLLGVAFQQDGESLGFGFSALREAASVSPVWFKAAFIFCLAGYGLKAGLAPFHTWMPETYCEAPPFVSVLLSGALINCAFLGIVRVLQIAPENLTGFCNNYLIALGILSLAVAAFFIFRQRDYTRMLAYSSVEHMGLAAVMWGVGAGDLALFHLGMHGLCKMMLFFVAGNILLAYNTRFSERIHGMFSSLPGNAVLWLGGMLLICGTPPSPLFFTEFLLVERAGFLLGSIVLLLLFMVFCGMAATILKMTMGGTAGGAFAPGRFEIARKLGIWPAVTGMILLGIGGFLTWMLGEVLA